MHQFSKPDSVYDTIKKACIGQPAAFAGSIGITAAVTAVGSVVRQGRPSRDSVGCAGPGSGIFRHR